MCASARLYVCFGCRCVCVNLFPGKLGFPAFVKHCSGVSCYLMGLGLLGGASKVGGGAVQV